MYIGIVGPMCSGKSSLAKYIMTYYEIKYNIKFHKESFAGKVYELAYDIFNMKMKDRELLQKIGTKMREIDINCWVNYTIKKSLNNENTIIDDGRYLNEIDAMKNNGFLLIRINIDKDLQISRIKYTYPDTWKTHIDNIGHLSELDIYKYPNEYFDYIINANNNNDFSEINKLLDKYYLEQNI